MQISDFLTRECALAAIPGLSKKRLFEMIAAQVEKIHPETEAEDVFDKLIERERLGSTSVGEGVAIPHCRIGQCKQTIGILMKLDTAIDFDAIDNQPVDLVFTLLVPEDAVDEHLKTLQVIAENFSRSDYRDKLRSADSNEQLYNAAVDNST